MDREIVWTLRATADLEAIVEYIFRDSEFYATAVARELVAAARFLTTFAERGRMVPEYENPAVRETIVRHYRLIYRVKPERVEVLRIIHGAQRMPPKDLRPARWARRSRPLSLIRWAAEAES